MNTMTSEIVAFLRDPMCVVRSLEVVGAPELVEREQRAQWIASASAFTSLERITFIEGAETDFARRLNKMLREEKYIAFNSRVRQFTQAAAPETDPLPKRPRCMSCEDATKIARFVLEEVYELLDATGARVWTDATLAKLVQEFAGREDRKKPETQMELIAEQADALADIQYFCGDAAAKMGVDLDEVVVEVHRANMRKVVAGTGKVLRRSSDGKVVKPEGWLPPNVSGVIKRQMLGDKI